MIKRVFTIATAVRDASATADRYVKLFGLKKIKEGTYPEGGVRKSIILSAGNVCFELMEPLEGDFPLRRFIEKRGEGVYHIGVVVDDIDKAARELEGKGAKVLMWTVSKAENLTMGYVNPKSTSGVIFELVSQAQWDSLGLDD